MRRGGRLQSMSAKRRRREATWRAVKAAVRTRSGGYCEACRGRRAVDAHHVVKRSQGGKDDPDGVADLCRPCHEATDLPFGKGRLVVTALGGGRFRFQRGGMGSNEHTENVQGLSLKDDGGRGGARPPRIPPGAG